LKERYKIGGMFGEAKQGHGLGRGRYLARMSLTLHSFLTVTMVNLKRLVKLLSRDGLKTQVIA
jgi:hypothetical protein